MCLEPSEQTTLDESARAEIAAKLAEWPHKAMAEIPRVARMVRSSGDAQALCRLAYVSVFPLVESTEWEEWDAVSLLISTGWDDPSRIGELIDHGRKLGKRLSQLAERLEKRRSAPYIVGRASWGILAAGVLAFAIAQRAQDLLEVRRAAKRDAAAAAKVDSAD